LLIQRLHYDCSVSPLKQTAIRLSPGTLKILAKLSAKLGIDRTNVIRLAIARLAESEGVVPPPAQR
jgi:predicted DNA-binding protein